jgi:hypothetical protein
MNSQPPNALPHSIRQKRDERDAIVRKAGITIVVKRAFDFSNQSSRHYLRSDISRPELDRLVHASARQPFAVC